MKSAQLYSRQQQQQQQPREERNIGLCRLLLSLRIVIRSLITISVTILIRGEKSLELPESRAAMINLI